MFEDSGMDLRVGRHMVVSLTGWRAVLATAWFMLFLLPAVLYGSLSGGPVDLGKDRVLFSVTLAWAITVSVLLLWGMWSLVISLW